MEWTFKDIMVLMLVISVCLLPFILFGVFIYELIVCVDNYNPVYSYIDVYGEEKVVDYCGRYFGTFYCEDNGLMFYVDNYKIEE